MKATEAPGSALTSNFEFQSLEVARNYRHDLMRTFGAHLRGRVLEIGAGFGHFTQLLLGRPLIRELISLEPNPEFCDRLRRTFPGHTVVQGVIDDLAPREDWDCILSVNVLEHIKEDERELAVYSRLLQSNKGVFCLFVPARPEIYAPLDRDFGHFRRYTRSELTRKLESAGFHVLNLYYYNFVGYFAWWLMFCLLKKRSFDLGAVRCFDSFVFPPCSRLERILHPPIGQSLVAIARAD